MKPVSFDLQPVKKLTPAVAYAAGLICEMRPDLADPVREAVLGDRTVDALNDLATIALYAGGAGGADTETIALCMRLLGVIWDIDGELRALVDALGLIRECPDYCVWCERSDGTWLCLHREDPFIERAGLRRSESSPPLGATWAHPCGPGVFGIPHDVTSSWRGEEGAAKARQTAAVWQILTTSGFGAAWALMPRETLWSVRKWVIAVIAHTISPDPAARAVWAKVHLGAA